MSTAIFLTHRESTLNTGRVSASENPRPSSLIYRSVLDRLQQLLKEPDLRNEDREREFYHNRSYRQEMNELQYGTGAAWINKGSKLVFVWLVFESVVWVHSQFSVRTVKRRIFTFYFVLSTHTFKSQTVRTGREEDSVRQSQRQLCTAVGHLKVQCVVSVGILCDIAGCSLVYFGQYKKEEDIFM